MTSSSSWFSPAYWQAARLAKTKRVAQEVMLDLDSAVQSFLAAEGKRETELPETLRGRVGWARTRLADLERQAEETRRGADHEALRDRMEELRPSRAYLLPAVSLSLEAHALRDELSTWRVPKEVLDEFDAAIKRIDDSGCQEPERREILLRLIEAFDYWDWYVDWSARRTAILAVGLGVAATAATAGAFWLLLGGHVFSGFCIAGFAGAVVSVLLKMPSIAVYGETASFHLQAGVRVAAGLMASAIGLGLLVAGIVNVGLVSGDNARTFESLVLECRAGAEARKASMSESKSATRQGGGAASEGDSPCPTPSPAQPPTPTGAQPEVVASGEAQPTPAKVTQPPGPAEKAGAPPELKHEVADPKPTRTPELQTDPRKRPQGKEGEQKKTENGNKPPDVEAVRRAGLTSTLILFSIGALLGFSERVLTSFEGILASKIKAP